MDLPVYSHFGQPPRAHLVLLASLPCGPSDRFSYRLEIPSQAL